jgi:hypothetical protein
MTLYPAYLIIRISLLGKKEQFKEVTLEWMENLAQLGLPAISAWASPS